MRLQNFLIIRSIFYCFFTLTFLYFINPVKVSAISTDLKYNRAQFIPNEVIIKYKSDYDYDKLRDYVAVYNLREQSIVGRAINLQNDLSYALKGEKSPKAKFETLQMAFANVGIKNQRNLTSEWSGGHVYYYLAKGDFDVLATVEALKETEGVEYAEPNMLAYAQAVPNDSLFEQQWALKIMEAPAAWDSNQQTKIKVAVVDSGVDYSHEDLAGHVTKGYDFATCKIADFDTGICIETKPRDDDPMDVLGHGTHVSGIIGAVTNNSLGIAANAWNTEILAIRVLSDNGAGSTVDISDGLDYAIDHGSKIINLSLGGPGSCSSQSLYYQKLQRAQNQGILVVKAAGNESTDVSIKVPAGCPQGITISATGSHDERAGYSNFGNGVDLAAPGGNNPKGTVNGCIAENDTANCILSTVMGTLSQYAGGAKYIPAQGTSMAAPNAAGVAALVWSVVPSLSLDQLINILKNTADDLGTAGKDIYYGYGRINAHRAVNEAQGGPVATSTPSPTVGGPTSTITATPPPHATSTPSPTIGPTTQVTNTPTPTSGPSCPAQCSGNVPPRSKGNADCNQVIDYADFSEWLREFLIYQSGSSIAANQRLADFDCTDSDLSTQTVSMSDFEFWRRGYYGNMGTPTPTSSQNQPTKTPTPTSGITATPSPTSTQQIPTATVTPATGQPTPTSTPPPGQCYTFYGAYPCSDNYTHSVVNANTPVGHDEPLTCVPGQWQIAASNCYDARSQPWGQIEFNSCTTGSNYPSLWQGCAP